MNIQEVTLADEVLQQLIAFSRDWEAERSCHGYRANGREDIEGNRVFLAEENGETIGYLFGHGFRSENMRSIMPEESARVFISSVSSMRRSSARYRP